MLLFHVTGIFLPAVIFLTGINYFDHLLPFKLLETGAKGSLELMSYVLSIFLRKQQPFKSLTFQICSPSKTANCFGRLKTQEDLSLCFACWQIQNAYCYTARYPLTHRQ